MAITFAVDDVAPATDRLPTRRRAEVAGEVLALGGDPELPLVDHGATHPLIGAVHRAFADHRPLVLSPDAVWLTIAQGLAQHVKLHAAALRPRLVRHAGRKRIQVAWNSAMPTDAASWTQIVDRFRDAIAGEVGDGRARLLECDFSTTGEPERVASQIVLMDVYAPYFDYYMMCICGIPEVTLLGTPADWRAVRARIDVIAELDLAWWTDSLAKIADELVRAAEGRPDVRFWQAIYKPRSAYGGELCTGWIARLYPYLRSDGQAAYRNPMLAIGVHDVTLGDGIAPRNLVAGLSTVKVHCLGGDAFTVGLEGGVVGVTQDGEGRLAAVCGWALRPARAEIDDVIDRIRAAHDHEPPDRGPHEGPAEHLALYRAIGGATVFGWRIRPFHERVGKLLRMIDLPDGSFIAFSDRRNLRYVHCPAGPTPPSRVPIVATSLADLLERALDSEGSVDLPVLGYLEA